MVLTVDEEELADDEDEPEDALVLEPVEAELVEEENELEGAPVLELDEEAATAAYL